VNLTHVVLRRSLKQSRRWGLVGRSVADDVDPPPRARHDGGQKALTGEQLRQLLGAIDGPALRALLALAPGDGLRFGEAAALRWDDVGRRSAPLPPSMVPILAGQPTATWELRLSHDMRKRIHDLRHTYATRLFANNEHVRAVQELMGHSRWDMMMELYTGSVPEVLRDAADRLDVVFSDRQARSIQSAAAELHR
jgi:integrase